MEHGRVSRFVLAIAAVSGGALAEEQSTKRSTSGAPIEASKIIENGISLADKTIGNGGLVVAGTIIGNGSPAAARAADPSAVVEKAAARTK
jgi:hypothetical protein